MPNGSNVRRWSALICASLVTICQVGSGMSAEDRFATAVTDAQFGSAAILERGFLFDELPTPSCHASTIVDDGAGGLVAAWFAGSDEGEPDVGIRVARFRDGRWGKSVEVATGEPPHPFVDDTARYPCWNPVLFRRAGSGEAGGGQLLLFYKVGPNPQDWWGLVKKSNDGGETWTLAEPLRAAAGSIDASLKNVPVGPIKNKPAVVGEGVILSGTSTENAGWRVHFERSTDGGKTWQVSRPVNDGKAIGAIQPSILDLGEGRLLAIGRTRGSGRIFRVASDDAGLTWGEMTLLDLPNPSSGTDAVTLADGRHLLVYNHTERGRSPLNVAISDDGIAWRPAVTLETEPGEYSYPAVIQADDGRVHVTYTWKRQRIAHVVLDPAALSP